MKDVIRKKLGVANSVPIHLLQVRHGKSLDLEDGMFVRLLHPLSKFFFFWSSSDDDFDAFHAYVHAKQSAHVEVVVGSDSEVKSSLLCVVFLKPSCSSHL
jgi:hypothetical protein